MMMMSIRIHLLCLFCAVVTVLGQNNASNDVILPTVEESSDRSSLETEIASTLVTTSTVLSSTKDTGETFEDVEKRMKAGVGSIIKMLLPHLIQGSAETKVSGACTASILKVIGGVRQLREWAMRFLDATGKIPAGILEGTSVSLGNYDECLEIAVGRKDQPPKTESEIIMKGQYCLLELHRPEGLEKAVTSYKIGDTEAPIAKTKTFLNMLVRYKHLSNSTMKVGVCVPSKCSAEDLESILNSESVKKYIGRITIQYCKEKGEDSSSLLQKTLLSFFAIIVGFSLLCTIADACFRIKGEVEVTKTQQISCARLMVEKCSLYSNSFDALSCKDTGHPLPCLRGLRVIIVGIVIYSHTYVHNHKLHFQKFSGAANFLKFFESFTFSGIGNGSVTLDSIIMLAAVTITYTRWRHVSKKDTVKLNIVHLILERFFRFSAAQLLAICIFLLFPILGSGPFWSAYIDSNLENCRKRWWLNFIFISNFYETFDLCLYHTWILALLLQMTIISAFIIWILKRSVVFAILLMVILTLAGIVGVAIMTVIHDLPGGLAFFLVDARTFQTTWEDMFTLPYDHIGALCLGLGTGYFLAVKKDCLHINRLTSSVLWCLSIAMNCSVMFGLYGYRDGTKMDTPLAVFYASMHRNAWCLGISWIIISCSTHHGGPASRLLKAKIFIPFDRLCYMAYIIHVLIMFYHSGVMRELMFMGHLENMFLAVSYCVLSFIASFILHIIFVNPYFALEEYVREFFNNKDRVSFRLKQDGKTNGHDNNHVEGNKISESCVNLGYSKSLDTV